MEPLDEIIRLLRGELNDSQKNMLFMQMEHDKVLRDLYIEHKNLWVKTGAQPVLTEVERKDDFVHIWKKVSGPSKRMVIGYFTRYAAIAVIALMIGSLAGYFINGQLITERNQTAAIYTFSSGDRSISEVTLPDGSTLKLNAQSKITFQQDLQSKHRLVTLEGEAYFDVMHDEESPFIIDFGELKIIDLGTAFNVKAYKEQANIVTTLFEGAVDMVVGGSKKASLVPGQKANYNKSDSQVQVSTSVQTDELAWIRDRFVFHDVPLKTVMNELALWYGMRVSWQNETQKNTKLHLDLKRANSIETIMEMLKLSVNMNYEIIQRKDGLKEIVIK